MPKSTNIPQSLILRVHRYRFPYQQASIKQRTMGKSERPCKDNIVAFKKVVAKANRLKCMIFSRKCKSLKTKD